MCGALCDLVYRYRVAVANPSESTASRDSGNQRRKPVKEIICLQPVSAILYNSAPDRVGHSTNHLADDPLEDCNVFLLLSSFTEANACY